MDLRLERLQERLADQRDILDPVGLRSLKKILNGGVLIRIGGDDEFAAAPMRYPPLGAILVERATAFDAEPRFHASGLVVEASVDHLAVARGDALADAGFGFENENLEAARGQR